MENHQKFPKVLFSQKKNTPRSFETINTSDSYLNSHVQQVQKEQQQTKEKIHFPQRISFLKKFAQTSKSIPQKSPTQIQTVKSMIVASKYQKISQSYESLKNFTSESVKIPTNMFVPPPTQDCYDFHKKSSQKISNLYMNKYLQMAKKQKEKSYPPYTLMFTPKNPKFQRKNQTFFTQQIRQKQGTISKSQIIYKPSLPKVSDFHQVRLLGKGKNGQVYLVIHKATGFACAMKIIKKSGFSKCNPVDRQTLYEQLLRQIKLQSYLCHPNLVELYCVFSDKENIYMIQELGIDGQLYDFMRKKFHFSQQSTALLAREILKGLKSMHQKKIIHRDIKPQNIVLIYGIAKLCDFGWSVYCPNQIRSTLCGTPLYLSPEILVGSGYNQKIDIWAFGTLVYELYTGENPFMITDQSDLKKIVTEDLQFTHNFPKRLRSFLDGILKKNSSERPTAKELEKHEFLKKYEELQTSEELVNL